MPQTMSAQEKLYMYRKQLMEEFIREFNFIADVRAGRAQARGDFTDKLLVILNAGVGAALNKVNLPGASLLSSLIEIGIGWFNNKRKEDRHNYISQQQAEIDHVELQILLELVVCEASRRYEFFITTKLPDKDRVILFATVGVARMLEYIARHRLILNYDNLLTGLIEGRSGRLITDYINTTLIPKSHNENKITAEGAYGRTAFMTADNRYWILPDKEFARYKLNKDSQGLLEQINHKKDSYGYTKLNKNREPKYGFIMVPKNIVDYYYVSSGKCEIKVLDELSRSLKKDLENNRPSIQVVTRENIKAYLSELKITRFAGFNDYIRAKYKNPNLVATIYLPDKIEEFDLTGIDFRHSDFSNCILNSCTIAGPLTNAKFKNASLVGANFTGVTDAEGADFSNAHMAYLQGKGATLRGAILTQAQLHYAKLNEANLQRTITFGTSWVKADLTGIKVDTPQHLDDLLTRQDKQQKDIEDHQTQLRKIQQQIGEQNQALEKMTTVLAQLDQLESSHTITQTVKQEVQTLQAMVTQLVHDKASYEANSRFYEDSIKSLSKHVEGNAAQVTEQKYIYAEFFEKQESQLLIIATDFEKLSSQLQEQQVCTQEFAKQKEALESKIKCYQDTQQTQIKTVEVGLANLQTEVFQYKQKVDEEQEFFTQQLNSLQKQIVALKSDRAILKPAAIDPLYLIYYFQLKLIKQIASGSIANVYLGRWSETDVAIKMFNEHLTPDVADQFLREVNIMRHVHHPQVVQLYGACLEEGHACLVMEYMAQGSLYNYIGQQRVLSKLQQKEIALDIARGLNHLHTLSKPILHRDFRSTNILIDRAGKAKLSGLGLAKIDTMSVHTTNRVSDCIPWLAPECFSVNSAYTAASDIYSFGVILWEIVTGQRPRKEEKHIPDFVPSVYANIIRECWQENPVLRPTVSDIITRIESYQVQFTPNFLERPVGSDSHKAESVVANMSAIQTLLQKSNKTPQLDTKSIKIEFTNSQDATDFVAELSKSGYGKKEIQQSVLTNTAVDTNNNNVWGKDKNPLNFRGISFFPTNSMSTKKQANDKSSAFESQYEASRLLNKNTAVDSSQFYSDDPYTIAKALFQQIQAYYPQATITLERGCNIKIELNPNNNNHLQQAALFATLQQLFTNVPPTYQNNVIVLAWHSLTDNQVRHFTRTYLYQCILQLTIVESYGTLPEQRAFAELLHELRQLIVHNTLRSPTCFISYAWENDLKANEHLQAWLLRLQADLQHLGAKVYLDVTHMSGEMEKYMRAKIKKSDYIFLIGTPHSKQRAEDPNTSLAFELNCVREKLKTDPNVLIPLLYSGDFGNSFPSFIMRHLIRDCSQTKDYYNRLVGLTKPLGIIPSLYGFRKGEPQSADYQQLIEHFETKLAMQFLTLENARLKR